MALKIGKIPILAIFEGQKFKFWWFYGFQNWQNIEFLKCCNYKLKQFFAAKNKTFKIIMIFEMDGLVTLQYFEISLGSTV